MNSPMVANEYVYALPATGTEENSGITQSCKTQPKAATRNEMVIAECSIHEAAIL